MGEDDLVELLWKSGHVVESSQALRPPVPPPPPILRGSGSGGGSGEETAPLPHPPPLHTHQQPPSDDQNLFMREDEMASWLHHHPPLGEDEFRSHLLYSGLVGTPFTQPHGSLSLTPPPPLPPPQESTAVYTPTPAETPSPMGQVIAETRAENFFNFSRVRGNIYTGGRIEAAAAAQWVPLVNESTQVGSSATPSSSATESCLTPATVTSGVLQTFAVPRAVETVRELPGPSSSGVSKTDTEPFQILPATETEAAAADERKRKEREEPADDPEVSLSSEETGEEARGSTSRKRSRAAEMHNISERRRREKINEKMKALQELIPRCNKTDKASMLDDAIEYVKSLQMQIQMMSTGGGGGMMPMMYNPNMQRFMPPSAMGMMNRPPFIPYPGTPFPRQAHMAGLAPLYPATPPRYPFPNAQAFDPSSVHLPTQQPDPNQPQFPGYLNPYSQFAGLQQMQPPPPPPPPPLPPQLQNQTTSHLSFGQASSSKEPEDQDNNPKG